MTLYELVMTWRGQVIFKSPSALQLLCPSSKLCSEQTCKFYFLHLLQVFKLLHKSPQIFSQLSEQKVQRQLSLST